MNRKRKRSPSEERQAGSSNKRAKSGANANSKSKFNKEAFLRSLRDLKLYVPGDIYYDQANVTPGPLELPWSWMTPSPTESNKDYCCEHIVIIILKNYHYKIASTDVYQFEHYELACRG